MMSSNNLSQSVQTLDFDLKSCFVLLNTSSRSTHCWLASVSLFVALVCLGPRVALLVVVLAPSQSCFVLLTMLCVAQHVELLCSLLTCLRLNLSSFVLLNTSSRSAPCSLGSISIFAALVCSTPRSWSAHCWLFSTVETVCFNLSCFVLKPRLALLAVQLSLAAI